MGAPPRPAFARSWGPPTGPRAPDGLHARADRRAEARGAQASRAAGGCWPTRRGSARAAAAAIARAAGHCSAPALRGRAWVLYQSAGLDGRQRGAAAERSAVCTAHARSRDRAPAGVHLRARAARGRRGRRERAALLPASCRESHRAVELRVKGSMIHPRTPATARLTPDTRAPLGNLRPSHSRARDTACAPGARASAAESAPSVGCRAAGPPRTVAISPTSRNRFGRKLPFPVSMACLNVLSRRLRRANHCTQWSRIRTSTPIISAPRKMSLEKTKMGAVGSPPLGANPPGAASSRPRSARPRRKYSETHPQRKKKKYKSCGGSLEDPRSVPSVVPLRRQRSHSAPPAPCLGARGAPARVSTRPPNSLRRAPAVGFAQPRRRARGWQSLPGLRRAAARACCYVWRGGRAGPRTHAHMACAHFHGRMHTRRAPAHRGTHTHAHTRTRTHARTRSHTHTTQHTRTQQWRQVRTRARRTHSARAPTPLLLCRAALPLRRGAPFFFSCRSRGRSRFEAEPGPNPSRRGSCGLRSRLRAPPDRIRSLVWRAPRARPRSDRRPPPTPPQPQSFQPAYRYLGTWYHRSVTKK